jgi:hypothetical protein
MIEPNEQRTYADILDRQISEVNAVENALRDLAEQHPALGLEGLADRLNEATYQTYGIWWSMDGWEKHERDEAAATAIARARFRLVWPPQQ